MGTWTDAPITSPFILGHYWSVTEKPALFRPTMKNYLLTTAPAGDHKGPELFQTTELPGVSPRLKQYTTITGSLITEV